MKNCTQQPSYSEIVLLVHELWLRKFFENLNICLKVILVSIQPQSVRKYDTVSVLLNLLHQSGQSKLISTLKKKRMKKKCQSTIYYLSDIQRFRTGIYFFGLKKQEEFEECNRIKNRRKKGEIEEI